MKSLRGPVLDTLEATELDYLVGGAVAVWAYAEPRATCDFDVVVNLPGSRISPLFGGTGQARICWAPPDVILDILMQTEGDLPLNAVHMHSGIKADIFLLRAGDEYRATALSRRRLVDLGPPIGGIYVHSPEDLILNKVHYFSLSGQDKHIRDIAAILAYVGEQIDWPYFYIWLEQLGLAPVWDEVKHAVDALLR